MHKRTSEQLAECLLPGAERNWAHTLNRGKYRSKWKSRFGLSKNSSISMKSSRKTVQ